MTKRGKVNRKRPYHPLIGKNVYVDPSAQVIGRVRIGDFSSIWAGCVLRGDINKIVIGHHSNIQDLSLLHVETDRACRVGNYVVVGHHVVLHGCTVKNQSLVGMGSVLLDGSVVGERTVLGAGSLLTQGQRLKPGSLYLGSPAKFIRKLKNSEINGLKKWANRYVGYAADHRAGLYQRFDSLQNLR